MREDARAIGLWCLMPLSTYFSIIGEENQSTQRKPMTCCKLLTNFIMSHDEREKLV